MTFTKTDVDRIAGTSLQGMMRVSYQALVKRLGEPSTEGEGHKTDREWFLLFEDGTVATVYNYKDGPNYLGAEGTPPEEIVDWHVGGISRRAFYLVLEAVPETDASVWA